MQIFNYAQHSFATIKELGSIGWLDTQGYTDDGIYNNPLYKGVFKYSNAYESLPNSSKSLFSYCAIVIPSNIDEILLVKHKNFLEEYLNNGGIILSFAQHFLSWLPGNSLYQKSPLPIKDRSIVALPHPITEGVRDYDLNYAKGVKGFFSRGSFVAPESALVFLQNDLGQCVGYIDTTTTNGIILATAGADLFGFPLLDHNTSRRLGINVLIWLESLLIDRKKAA